MRDKFGEACQVAWRESGRPAITGMGVKLHQCRASVPGSLDYSRACLIGQVNVKFALNLKILGRCEVCFLRRQHRGVVAGVNAGEDKRHLLYFVLKKVGPELPLELTGQVEKDIQVMAPPETCL